MPVLDPHSRYHRAQREKSRFHQLLYQAQEQVSLLESERYHLTRELERLRNYSWSLYHEYIKGIEKLEEARKERSPGC
ncbi:hypothetical protein N7450_011623 [Penicillium hetheringtonii]|uniref:Uncharacterized protein n=1 Tax=Penicillium hetheringtonii TaxID=911720 RepID=A0AAD6GN57_9EURO|nr:hypothetical protein N7450_011623 [Penicillium hetheringtonii]